MPSRVTRCLLPLTFALLAPLALAQSARVSPEVLARGLQNPWGMAFVGEGRVLVTERPGRMRLVGADGRIGTGTQRSLSASAEDRARQRGQEQGKHHLADGHADFTLFFKPVPRYASITRSSFLTSVAVPWASTLPSAMQMTGSHRREMNSMSCSITQHV